MTSEKQPTRVLLVDDHPVLRETLSYVFDGEPDFEVVACAGSLAEARRELAGTEVDLAVLDLDLPDGFGTDLMDDLKENNPLALALVLTGISERTQLALAVDAGASGVASKSARLEDIVGAARRLCAGEQLLSPQEIVEAMRFTSRKRREDHDAQLKLGRLTPREREVLEVLAEGLVDKEIAKRLHVGVGTVRTHVESILRKLQVSSRLQALVFAARHGAIQIS